LAASKKEKKDNPVFLMIPITVFILFFDQFSKFLITKNLFLGQSIPIIKGFFHLTPVHNRGAAFGILKNQVVFLIFVSLFAIVLIYSNLKRRDAGNKISLHRVALGLILAGALGNLIDRLCYGYVIDFLDFRIWPVFNLADSAITIGAVLLGWSLLKESK
jgi:signal peptidase II